MLAVCRPMARTLARGFTKNYEFREDLVQESLCKLLQTLSADECERDAPGWQARAYVILKNCMTDQLRSYRARQRLCAAPVEDGKEERTPFDQLCAQHAIRELQRLLPDLERRILLELIEPSEGFRWFLRKKRVLFAINGMAHRSELSDNVALSEYFGLSPRDYAAAMQTIRDVAAWCGIGKAGNILWGEGYQ